MKVFQNILLDNHYCNNTTDQRLKLLRTPVNTTQNSFPLQTEQQELKLHKTTKK